MFALSFLSWASTIQGFPAISWHQSQRSHLQQCKTNKTIKQTKTVLILMPGSDCSDFGSKCTRWQRLYQDTLALLLYVGRIWRCAVQLSACRCFQLLKHLFPVKKLMWKLLNLLLDTTSFRKILLKLDKTEHLVKTIFSWKYTQIKICSFSQKELVPRYLSEAHQCVLNEFWTLEHQRQSN